MAQRSHDLTKLNPMLAKKVYRVWHGSRKTGRWWRRKTVWHPFSVVLSRLMAAGLVDSDILHIDTDWSAEEKAPETC